MTFFIQSIIPFRFIPDRPDSTSPDPIMRVKERLTINSKSLQVHKRNAIKLGLKSPLKAGQEREKVHVTGINEATFLWPENLRLSFLDMNSRSNYKVYKLPLLEGAITDLAVKWNVTGLYWYQHWWNLSTLEKAAISYWVELQRVRAEERANVLSLISLFFLLILFPFKEDHVYVMIKSYLYHAALNFISRVYK